MSRRMVSWSGLLVLGFLIGCGHTMAQAAPPDLLELCKTGTEQQVREAIATGAEVNAKDKQGRTPLMFAAFNNRNPEVIAALVKAGGDVNATNDSGKSVLDYGREKRNAKVLAELVKAGAK